MIRLRDFLRENREENVDSNSSKNTYISKEDAMRVADELGYSFDIDEFTQGMNVELEHQDVTNGDIVMTAKIAAAHLRENPKYYSLLKKYVESPSVHELALVAPNGTINGAPSEKDVKRTRKILDTEK